MHSLNKFVATIYICTVILTLLQVIASKDKSTMNSPSVKQNTLLMFVTLKRYGSLSWMNPLSHIKETFCSWLHSWLQVNAFVSTSEYACEYRWIYSQVEINQFVGARKLACRYGWSCSQVCMNLLMSPSWASATLHLSSTVYIYIMIQFKGNLTHADRAHATYWPKACGYINPYWCVQ